jgi:hypothetical protein
MVEWFHMIESANDFAKLWFMVGRMIRFKTMFMAWLRAWLRVIFEVRDKVGFVCVSQSYV